MNKLDLLTPQNFYNISSFTIADLPIVKIIFESGIK